MKVLPSLACPGVLGAEREKRLDFTVLPQTGGSHLSLANVASATSAKDALPGFLALALTGIFGSDPGSSIFSISIRPTDERAGEGKKNKIKIKIAKKRNEARPPLPVPPT